MKVRMKNILCIALLLFSVAFIANAQDEKKNGIITMKMVTNDSMHVVTATVKDAVTKISLKDVEVNFFIQRLFGRMNIGTATTDSTGIISASFSVKMPGSDTLGNIFILAKVEDNAVMNDTTFTFLTKSKVFFPAHTPLEPSIANPVAPLWLKITFWLIVGGVWGLFLYVILLIILINRNKNKSNAVIA